MSYHTKSTCHVVCLCIFMNAHAANFFLFLNTFLSLTLLLILKDKTIQTKIIPFSESTFKIKIRLGRTFFLILLTLAVNI